MVPLVYNLFPRLAGPLDQWIPHAERARRMGFNALYINPVSYPGFSGSLYAVKDYYRVCPDFLPGHSDGPGLDLLAKTLKRIRELGLMPIMDLVINHTAIDSELTQKHPEWYVHDKAGKLVSPSAIDPADARKVTVWGDLAEIDNEKSSDREGLWRYWRELVLRSVELGWAGFRCDAAYKVPAALWRMLIDAAKAKDPSALFFAETLGCRLEEVRATKQAGFDYLFNSSKYWQYDKSWAIDQHNEFGAIGPSLAFPESHDTPRLFAETGSSIAVQRQRYLIAAFFSAGLLMPIGYEFCFKKKLDVVQSKPSDWEHTGIDLSDFIRAVNELKQSRAVLREEGVWAALLAYDRPTLVLEKTCPNDRLVFLVNKDWWHPNYIELSGLPIRSGAKLKRIAASGQVSEEPLAASVLLQPAEIALVD